MVNMYYMAPAKKKLMKNEIIITHFNDEPVDAAPLPTVLVDATSGSYFFSLFFIVLEVS